MICTVRPFAGGHLEYLKVLKDTMVSQISKIHSEMKQKPSKNVSYT